MELEHVGIAVRDAESALGLMEAMLGERAYKSETVDAEGVRTHFIRAGTTKLELLEALNDESPVARFIESRGPGLHHLAFEVEDLEAVRDRLIEAGLTVLGSPRPGADGKRIFFVHPRDTGGVLYEFCRQSRSILTDSTVPAAGQPLRVRRAGTRGPVAIASEDVSIDLETLARRLEQSMQVIVTDDVAAVSGALHADDVHLILSSSEVSRLGEVGAHVQSLVVVIDRPIDISLVERPTLLAARPSASPAAIALYEGRPDAGLAVGDDDLLIVAIEKHMRRHGRS